MCWTLGRCWRGGFAIRLYALFPAPIDSRGPMAFLRVLATIVCGPRDPLGARRRIRRLTFGRGRELAAIRLVGRGAIVASLERAM